MGRTFKTTVVFCCFESKLHCYSANHESFFFLKRRFWLSAEKTIFVYFSSALGKKIPSLS